MALIVDARMPACCADCEVANDGYDWCALLNDVAEGGEEGRDRRCPVLTEVDLDKSVSIVTSAGDGTVLGSVSIPIREILSMGGGTIFLEVRRWHFRKTT